jgi:hypothetical protein
MKMSAKLRAGIFFSGMWGFISFLMASSVHEFDVMVFLVLGVFPLALIWGLVWVIKGFIADKQDPTKQSNFNKNKFLIDPTKKPDEIDVDGWLILPALGVVFTPFIILIQLFVEYRTWTSVMNPSFFQNELFYFDISQYVIILILSIIVFFKFFEKKKTTSRWIISYYIIVVLLSGLVVSILLNLVSYTNPYALMTAQSSAIGNFIGHCIIAIIWIPYFLLSKRVKRTFIN